MNRTQKSLSIALLFCVATANAQVFKWVGPDGKTNYSDVPPGPNAVRTQKKTFNGNVVDGEEMPFGLAEVAKANPVTLYTSGKCAPCDEGRKLLASRGIPFSEKTVNSNADIALLGGTTVELPQLSIGTGKLRGFDAGVWNDKLTSVGYPETSKLPKTYRNPVAAPAAPAAPVVNAEAGTPASDPAATSGQKKPPVRKPAAPPVETVPGLRF